VWEGNVEQIYQDLGARQQRDRLFQDCRAGDITCVLVRRLDELGDSVEAVSDCLSEFEQMGISLIAVDDEMQVGDRTVKRSELLRMLHMVQCRQRQRRLQRGHAQNRVKALPPPGKAPYGYRRGRDRYILDRATAPVIKDFYEHFLLYGSIRGSVRYLEKKYSKKIAVSTGKRWLTNPVYRGHLTYQTGETILDTHAPIISPDEAAQIDRLLRRNRKMPPRSASAPRSLAGLVRCGTCGSPMKISRVAGSRSRRDYLYLRPVACRYALPTTADAENQRPKCKSIPYEEALDQTIQRICDNLPRAVAEGQPPDLDSIKRRLKTQLSSQEDILEQLPALVGSGILDAETADLRAYKIRTRMAELQMQLTQLPPISLTAIAQTVSIPQFWLDLSEAERRFYFREFIQHIQIIRGDRPQEWHVELVLMF
jgi:DNA invertase Pin-like site-specific DNA recombinase